MTEPPTPLELLLSGGRASSTLVLGSGAPERLRPRFDGAPADLVIIAPDDAEASQAGWVNRALNRAMADVAPGGMLYCMLPAAQRRIALRQLLRLGYRPASSFLHHPGFPQSEHLVPGDRASLRRWLLAGEGLTPSRRRLASLALTVPGMDRLAVSNLPSIGVAAVPAGAHAPFAWLREVTGAPVERALVRAKWRAGQGNAVVTGLDRSGRPVAVAKIALGGEGAETRAAREAERLERLGPEARRTGAAVPTPALTHLRGGYPVLLLTPVSGPAAAGLIGAGLCAPEAIIGRLSDWLARWNAATLVVGRLDEAWTERELLAPLRLLTPDLPASVGYLDWLHGRAAAARGEPLPSVATHGDLTMSNVLVAEDALGVVDWEKSHPSGVPLRDLLYAAVDATAARDGYRDRLGAFDRCFPRGNGGAPLRQAVERLTAVAGLTKGTAALCVHACWLQHAADERLKRSAGEARPFLSIVRRLAERARSGDPLP